MRSLRLHSIPLRFYIGAQNLLAGFDHFRVSCHLLFFDRSIASNHDAMRGTILNESETSHPRYWIKLLYYRSEHFEGSINLKSPWVKCHSFLFGPFKHIFIAQSEAKRIRRDTSFVATKRWRLQRGPITDDYFGRSV